MAIPMQKTSENGDILHRLAWNSNEKYSMYMNGYKPFVKNNSIPKPAPLGKKTITLNDVQRNRQTYKKINADPIPRVSRGSDPILSSAPRGMIKSDKKFNIYRGVGKSVIGKSKIIPSPIRKGGLKGALLTGAVAMLNVSIMKGALNPGRFEVYGRMMQNMAVGKNMLNNTRLGLASGTSRMNDMGHTMGLVSALSRTRHGRA